MGTIRSRLRYAHFGEVLIPLWVCKLSTVIQILAVYFICSQLISLDLGRFYS